MRKVLFLALLLAEGGGMIAARHQIAAQGRLYDSKVEYLQSDGTQWIDTGINQTEDLSISLAFMPISLNGQHWGCYFGCGESDDPKSNILGRCYDTDLGSWNPWFAQDSYDATRFSGVSTTSMNVATLRFGYTSINGAEYSISSKSGRLRSGLSIYLFDWHSTTHAPRRMSCRIASFQIRRNGELILDYIPVRVGSGGYMYDSVTKSLVGSNGTSAFAVGPDTREEFDWI